MPGNAQRVVPELILVGNQKQNGQIEAPQFVNYQYKTIGALYNGCPSLCFSHYLNPANKNEMEVLVRKLNMVLNGAGGPNGAGVNNNIIRLNQQQYQESFDKAFNSLCPILSRIYVNRLAAAQELERAAQAQVSDVRRGHVQNAVRRLRQSRSLEPLQPLQELFTRADAVAELMELILHVYGAQLGPLDAALRGGGFAVLAAALDRVKEQARQTYNKQTVSLGFSEQAGRCVPPFQVEDVLLSQQLLDLASAPRAQFGVSLQPGAPAQRPADAAAVQREALQALSEALQLLTHCFVLEGVQETIARDQAPASTGTRSMSVLLKCVQGCTAETWHRAVYTRLYQFYICASALLDAAERVPRRCTDAQQCNKRALGLIRQRCADALTEIRSPYIEQFLLGADHELYLRFLRRARRGRDVLGFVHSLVENGGAVRSVLPNDVQNGVYVCENLNFYQMKELVQAASGVLRRDVGGQG